MKYDGTNWLHWTELYNNFPFDDTWQLTIDKNNNVWIGTHNNGLIKFDGDNYFVFNDTNSGLPDKSIFSLCFDSQYNLWIGTRNGLVKFDGISWVVYNELNSGLPINEVTAINFDQYDNKWIGTAGGGLAVFREGGVILSADDNIPEEKSCYKINISPNPATDKITIEFAPELMRNARVSIFDCLGTELLTQNTYGKQIEFDCSPLPNGIYFCVVKSESKAYSGKFVVLR